MVKKAINILIFLFIFSLYFISFLMIYDNFRERKLDSLENNALDKFDEQVKVKKVEEEQSTDVSAVSYGNYTILGKIEIPKIGFTSVIIKEYTYNAMNIGVIKSYGSNLNEPGGFVLVGHNFRGHSLFMYNIYRLVDGDKIYITDTIGRKVEYTVYDVIRHSSPSDVSIYKEYDGYHVTLLTCEDDDGQTRIVVKAHTE